MDECKPLKSGSVAPDQDFAMRWAQTGKRDVVAGAYTRSDSSST